MHDAYVVVLLRAKRHAPTITRQATSRIRPNTTKPLSTWLYKPQSCELASSLNSHEVVFEWPDR